MPNYTIGEIFKSTATKPADILLAAEERAKYEKNNTR